MTEPRESDGHGTSRITSLSAVTRSAISVKSLRRTAAERLIFSFTACLLLDVGVIMPGCMKIPAVKDVISSRSLTLFTPRRKEVSSQKPSASSSLLKSIYCLLVGTFLKVLSMRSYSDPRGIAMRTSTSCGVVRGCMTSA